MPCTQTAPAAPGNQAPTQVPPSLRRLPSPQANIPRTPKPFARGRVVTKAPYPDLPETPSSSGGRVTHAEFDRAVFLRQAAEWQAGEKLIRDLWQRKSPPDQALRMFVIGASIKAGQDLREDFNRWMESCGGMAGPGFVTQ